MNFLLDFANFSFHASAADNTNCSTVGYEGARKQEVDFVLDSGLVLVDRIGNFVNGVHLTSQYSLVGLEGDGFEAEHSEVCGYAVALFDLHDVSDHKFPGFNLGPLSVSQNDSVRGLKVFESFDGSFGV